MVETCWDQIDAMKKSGDELLEMLKRRRNGWRMKDPKFDGTMVAERSERSVVEPETGRLVVVRTHAIVTGKTHSEVRDGVARADGVCPRCFHRLSICGPKGCNAPMRHLPKVIVTMVVKGKKKQQRKAPLCGCQANVEEAR